MGKIRATPYARARIHAGGLFIYTSRLLYPASASVPDIDDNRRERLESRGVQQRKGDQHIHCGSRRIDSPLLASAGRKSAAVLEAEDGSAILDLDEHSRIRGCNPHSEILFRYVRGEMLGQPVSMLFPEIAGQALIDDGRPNPDLLHLSHSALIDTEQLNPRVLFLFRIGQRFQTLTRDGEHFVSELFLNLRENQERRGLSLIVRPFDETRCPRWATPWLSERSVCSATRRRIR